MWLKLQLQVLGIQHLTLLSTMLLLSWLTDVLWSDGQCYVAAIHPTSMFKTVNWVWNGNKAVCASWAWDFLSLCELPLVLMTEWVKNMTGSCKVEWVKIMTGYLKVEWLKFMTERPLKSKKFCAGPGPPAYEFPHLLPPNSTTEYIDTITEVTNSSLKMFICSLARAAIGWSLSASKPPYSVATP